ncbi:hypothetical protein, partial [Actinomadura keratinilytica]|uniref:hypothetical protein n=1 Tax=Actinomadura keratinilytica TaxID=547461 RepID=UPI0031EF47AE
DLSAGRAAGGARPRPAAPPRTAKTSAKTSAKAPGKTPGRAPRAGAESAQPAKPAKAALAAKAERAAPRSAARRGAAPPRTPFVLLIVGLLGGALVSLLLLNTVLAEDAFTLTRLQKSNKLLAQQKEALQEDIAREESPAILAQRAEALGMVRPTQVAYLDEPTGRVIGGPVRPVPHAAAATAGAAGVVGIPGAVVPGDGVPTSSDTGASGEQSRTGQTQNGQAQRPSAQRSGAPTTGAP